MATQRQRLLVFLALVLFGVFYALTAQTFVSAMVRPGPGLIFFDSFYEDRSVGAVPATLDAVEQAQGMQPLLRVLSINGVDPRDLPGSSPVPVRLRKAALRSETGHNTFVVTDGRGVERQLELTIARPEFRAFPGFLFLGLAYALVGLFYLGVGLWVWRRRPHDPGAPWLVTLGIVAATQLSQPAPDDALGRQLNLLAAAMLPLYGPVALGLAGAFTGVRLGRVLRRVRGVVFVAAPLLTVALPLSFEVWARGAASNQAFRAAMVLSGAELALSIGLFLWVCRRAMYADHPPAVRRRARILAIAAALSFGLPALELMLYPFIKEPPLILVVPNLLCLVTFPVTLGYAIVRYQLFDLRVVLRRGVVYAGLSLLVSLAFVGVVLLLVQLVGVRAQSTTALWLTSFLLVVGIGLLQLRVQALVDRWVHRKRDRYAAEVEAVSEQLVRAHSLAAAIEIARRAFVETMRLSRAYVSLLQDGKVSCVMLGNHVDPETGARPEVLPDRFNIEDLAPVHRAWSQEAMTTAYDADSLPSMPGAQPLAGEFWSRFGLEVVVPLARKRDGRADTVGFLLLGPRRDGRPLDVEDRNLVHTLGHQLTVAVENALAFEQIQALKEGLEDRVQARTRDLERALADLKSAEATIIESEKQAMLGRLVAGLVHEINSPLGVLRSSADTLQRVLTKLEQDIEQVGTSDGAQKRLRMARDLVALQRGGGARIGALVDSLKNFVSLDEARQKHVDVLEGIDSALHILAGEIGDSVRVIREYPAKVPSVWAHAQRLNEAFLHVLQNAVHAVRQGGEIRISVVTLSPERICVTIRDTGPGIEAEALPGLFEFGFSSKNGRMGLRLGLPSSQRTVRAMGGEIRVESQVGEGTAVHIELPCRPATG